MIRYASKRKDLSAALIVIIAVLCVFILMFTGCGSQEVNGKHQASTGTDTYDFESFNNVNVDIPFGDVTLRQGDAFGVTVERQTYPQLVVESNESGVLSISLPEGATDAQDASKCAVTIAIPEAYKLSMVSIITQKGTVETSDVEAAYVEAKTTDGDISAKKVSAANFDFAAEKGDVAIEGLADEENLTLYLVTKEGTVTVSGEDKGTQFIQSGPVPYDPAIYEETEEPQSDDAIATEDEATETEGESVETEVGSELEAVGITPETPQESDLGNIVLENTPVIVNVSVKSGNIDFK